MARETKAKSSSLADSPVAGLLFSRVVGQSVVCYYLRRAIENRRIAHAYLFTGPAGVGKDAVALDFAATLLCEKFDSHPEETPCRSCAQCRLTARLQHPDLHVVAPLPGKAGLARMAEENDEGTISEIIDKKFLEALAKKALDPYFPILLPHARDILIGQIRILTNQASRMPFQSSRKVFVIAHADRMNINAQNAFLKVLEEPPLDTHLILTSEREGVMLETIHSRCQHVVFQPLSEADIEEGLRARYFEPEEAIPLISRLAGGSLRRALELSGMDWNALQSMVVDYMANCARLDPMALEDDYVKLLSDDFSGLSVTLCTLQLFLRDVAFLKAARQAQKDPKSLMVLQGMRKRAEDLLNVFPEADLENAVQAVQAARDYLERGYTPNSVLTALSFRLYHALGPRQDSRRAVRKDSTDKHRTAVEDKR